MNGLITLLCLIWGSNWIAMKAAGDYFPPITFSAIRFLIGAVVLFVIVFYKRIPLPSKSEWKWYTICGLLQTTYVYGVNQPAILYVPAGIVCILGFTMPFWLTIMAHFIIPEERMTWNKGIGLVLGICGLFLVMHINPFQMKWDGKELLIEILVISGAVAWAVANLIIKTKLQGSDKFQFTAYQMGIGAIALIILSFTMERGQPVIWNVSSTSSVLFAGVIASAFAYVLWFYILSKVEASKASVTLLLVPVIGVLTVWLFFHEQLNGGTIFGMMMVVAGIAIVNHKQGRNKVKPVQGEHAS